MIVFDTHAWFYWINDSIDQLSASALKSIRSSKSLGVCLISCWEIAMLVAKERLKLGIDIQQWVNEALKYPKVRVLALDPEIAVLSIRLPGQFHGDPADRLIVATCMKHNAPLLTRDKRIHEWGYVNVIW